MRPLPSFNLSKSSTRAGAYSSSGSDSEDQHDDHRYPALGGDDHDHDGEFQPRKRRRRAEDAKERDALGVFASDSEHDGPQRGWKRKRLRGMGMAFVAGDGRAEKRTDPEEEDKDDNEGDKDEKDDEDDEGGDEGDDDVGEDGRWPAQEAKEENEDQDEDDDMKDYDDETAGYGFGFKPSSMPAPDPGPDPDPAPAKFSFTPFVPSSAHQPVLPDDDDPPPDRETRPGPRGPQPSAFGTGGKVNKQSFAARMMAKMGYVQGGLGAEGQGRDRIIEVQLRPQGVGLGAVQEKSQKEREREKKAARERGEKVVDSDEEERIARRRRRERAKMTGGSATAAAAARKPRKRFLTADDVRAAAPGLHIPEAFGPILDMTGPGSRLLTSTSGLLTPSSSSAAAEPAELVESRRLIRSAQADLLAFAEEWSSLEERRRWVEHELAERQRQVDETQARFDALRLAAKAVSEGLESAAGWDETVACLRIAADLDSTGGGGELADLAVAALHPLLRASEWDPLAEPTRFAADLQLLSPILIKSPPATSSSALAESSLFSHLLHPDEDVSASFARAHRLSTTPFESMLYTLWLPAVLAAVRAWDPRDPTAVISLFEAWDPVLPPFVRTQVVGAVSRRLEGALAEWRPGKGSSSSAGPPPHVWLFPWLPHLPAYHLDPRGTGLVAGVRRRFRQLVESWDFARGPVPGLASWRPVFGEDRWRSLALGSVLPAMGRALRDRFRVDPADQAPSLPVLQGVLAWAAEPLLGPDLVGSVLAREVFPAWHARLADWLGRGDDADLGEIAAWFGWWTDEVLPPAVRDVAEVTAELDRANRRLAALVSDEAIRAG